MANLQMIPDFNLKEVAASRTSAINPDHRRSLHGEAIVVDVRCLWSSQKSRPRPRTRRFVRETALPCLRLAVALNAQNSRGSIRLSL